MTAPASTAAVEVTGYRWPRGGLFCLAVFIAATLLSVLIPPFQSPDEFDHIKRAHFLTRGQILLDAPKGNASGGMIDDGLETYIAGYLDIRFKTERKLSADQLDAVESVDWAGKKHFSPAPGTGYYFPLNYLPQAIGLGLGELTGMTVGHSVQLARFFALAATLGLLFAAFRIARPNPLVYTLLLLPMTLFQLSTASLDGVSTALSVLAIACFMRITVERDKAPPYLLAGLATCLALVVSCRVHLLPMLLLLPAAWWFTRNRAYLVATGVVSVLVLGWLALAIGTTVDGRVNVGLPPSGVIGYYAAKPWHFFGVLGDTLSDPLTTKFYRESFLGMLGWIDQRFSPEIYDVLGGMVAAMALLSVSIGTIRRDWPERALLMFCSLSAVVLVFFALLVGWTPHPAAVIQGVQGRYFLVPALLVAYALGGTAEPGGVRAMRVFRWLGPAFFLMSSVLTVQAVVERYYLVPRQLPELKYTMKPSPMLSAQSAITLHWASQRRLRPLKRLGIQIGTYIRTNPGVAELQLEGPDGHSRQLPIDLPKLVDNGYAMFELDGQTYNGGRIVFKTGGGISAWEAHAEGARPLTCMVYEFTDGGRVLTDGCPRP